MGLFYQIIGRVPTNYFSIWLKKTRIYRECCGLEIWRSRFHRENAEILGYVGSFAAHTPQNPVLLTSETEEPEIYEEFKQKMP